MHLDNKPQRCNVPQDLRSYIPEAEGPKAPDVLLFCDEMAVFSQSSPPPTPLPL